MYIRKEGLLVVRFLGLGLLVHDVYLVCEGVSTRPLFAKIIYLYTIFVS